MKDNNSSTGSIVLAVIIIVVAIYYLFKYLGIYIAYGLILISIGYFIYNLYIKNFSKKTIYYSLFFLLLACGSFGLSILFDGSGHEKEIKAWQIQKAESMGMEVNSVSVEYIGDDEYSCEYDVYDPGSIYSSPQRLRKTIIYQWENNECKFIRSE